MDSAQTLRDPNVEQLAEALGDPVQTTTGELKFNSPFRHKFRDPSKEDRKGHLYVNIRKSKFICFKSGVAGSLSYLFHLLGLDLDEEPVRSVASFDAIRGRLRCLGKRQGFKLPRAEIPDWSRPVLAGSEVHRYLRGRGVADEDIDYYGIREGSGEYAGWLVVPNLNSEGECEYWVSRNTRKKSYLNPQVDRRFHVGFLNQAISASPDHVIICEGVFSAVSAGRDAVASYGKLVTDDQLRRIWDSGVRKITLALDGDAWKETLDTARRGLKIGFEVRVVPLPRDKDPDDLGRPAFRSLLKTCSVGVNSKSLVRLKLLTS